MKRQCFAYGRGCRGWKVTQLLMRFLYTYGQQPILQKSVAMHLSAGVRSSWLTLKSASLSPRFILYSLMYFGCTATASATLFLLFVT